MLNKVILIGRISQEIQTKTTAGGTIAGDFGLAVDEYYKGENRASFFNVKCFGKTAETIQSYAGKGHQIGLEGVLKQERWQDQNGNNRSKVVVIAQRIELLGGKKAEQNQSSSNNQAQQQKKQPTQSGQMSQQEMDDLPF